MESDQRTPIGMWALYHGLMDSYTRVAYYNPATCLYEIDTPKGQIAAKTLLGLEAQVREVYPALQVIDYPTGAIIRRAAKPVAPL